MPGLAGVIRKDAQSQSQYFFECMVDALRHNGEFQVQNSLNDEELFQCACVVNAESQKESRSFMEGDSGTQVWIDGNILNRSEIIKNLEGFEKTDAEDPMLICHLYNKEGAGFIERLDGNYTIVIYDKKRKALFLLNDRFGSRPINYCIKNGEFIFASEVKSILKGKQANWRLDRQAVADFFMFGFITGNKTLVEDVSVLPPASVLRYDVNHQRIDIKPYWTLGQLFSTPSDLSEDHLLEEINDRFKQAVMKTLIPDKPNLISLSGGLDSRAILSAIDTGEIEISSYTLGVPGCADQKLAERMSEIMKIDNTFLPMDRSYLEQFTENIKKMVYLTDGMFITHGVTELIALNFLKDNAFATLLRGHGGEVAKASLAWPLCVSQKILDIKKENDFVDHLLSSDMFNITSGVNEKQLFQDDAMLNIKEVARASLENALKDVKDQLTPGDQCVYLYIQEQHRRFTLYSLMIFGTQVETRVPFMDYRFLTSLFKAPLKMRLDSNIHKYIIKQNNPKLMTVPDSNTGARLTAGPMELFLLDKMNSVFKRLNIGGYKHYHDFDNWLRKSQQEEVRKILLDPVTLDRGGYRRDYVELMIDEHNSGRQNHGYFFEIMMIIELFQRKFL